MRDMPTALSAPLPEFRSIAFADRVVVNPESTIFFASLFTSLSVTPGRWLARGVSVFAEVVRGGDVRRQPS